ncbi:MAG: phosphatidylglycerophosphatase A [Acholeplasmatales bacterium]|jgi:phosphatidylglycerophosphatase A|nr:phosphatidylglycerophosphatase A [Acholeplasmatales bacterium]
MKQNPKIIYNREEMCDLNIKALKSRGVEIADIAAIAYKQQSKYTPTISYDRCVESVLRLLTYRDIFHYIQLGIEIDRLAEVKAFREPIQSIIEQDLGLFGCDETIGLDIARNYGTIGQTNFGDIDVNKVGIVRDLNEQGKTPGHVHTFLDDIVGALAAAASTRVAQMHNEDIALEGDNQVDIFELAKSHGRTKKI